MRGPKKEKFYSKPIKLSLLFRKQIKAKVFIILWDGMAGNCIYRFMFLLDLLRFYVANHVRRFDFVIFEMKLKYEINRI